MLKKALYSNWISFILIAFFLSTPQSGESIDTLEKNGVIYECKRIFKNKCYPCEGGPPIDVGDGIKKPLPDRECPPRPSGERSKKETKSKKNSGSADLDTQKTKAKKSKQAIPQATSEAETGSPDTGKSKSKKNKSKKK
jgi:hypothetical protein